MIGVDFVELGADGLQEEAKVAARNRGGTENERVPELLAGGWRLRAGGFAGAAAVGGDVRGVRCLASGRCWVGRRSLHPNVLPEGLFTLGVFLSILHLFGAGAGFRYGGNKGVLCWTSSSLVSLLFACEGKRA